MKECWDSKEHSKKSEPHVDNQVGKRPKDVNVVLVYGYGDKNAPHNGTNGYDSIEYYYVV